MAYIIGLVDAEELQVLEEAGYTVKTNLPAHFEFLGDSVVRDDDGFMEAIVWVSCDIGDLLELEETHE